MLGYKYSSRCTSPAVLDSTDILRADVRSRIIFRALKTFCLVLGAGKSLRVLAKVPIASEQPQQRLGEFPCNSVWEGEVKGFIKEIICEHNADGYLALHLPYSVFAGATDRHFIY